MERSQRAVCRLNPANLPGRLAQPKAVPERHDVGVIMRTNAQGIGRAVAVLYAREGADVAIVHLKG